MRLAYTFMTLLLATVMAGCGGNDRNQGDADTDVQDAVDTAGDGADTAADPSPDPTEDPAEDVAEDPAEDAMEDPGVDPGEDLAEDVTLDSVEDMTLDSGEDVVEDPGADATDAAVEDVASACGPLDVSSTDLESWTLCWMGTGTHAVFTLVFDNANDCDVTGVQVTGGSLRRSSDDAVVFTFAATSPDVSTPFSGTVVAGTSETVDYHASDGADGSGWDSTVVYVEADVTWDGGGPVNVKSPDTTLYCVD